MTPQAQAIVRFLEARGPIGGTNVELATIPGYYCQRFGARLWEAKKEGYQFSKKRQGPGSFRYWVIRRPSPAADLTRSVEVGSVGS